MIMKGEIKHQNMIFEVVLSINKTRNGWSQRYLGFSNEDELRAEPTIGRYLNVDYISHENMKDLKQWLKTDLDNFTLHDN